MSKKKTAFETLVEKANDGKTYTFTQHKGSDVDAWYNKANSTYQRAYKYLSSGGYKTADSALLADIDAILADADSIAQYLRANKANISDYDNVYKNHFDVVGNLRSVRNTLDESNSYYSQFETEDDYKRHTSGWLNPNAETNEDTIAQRQGIYKSNQDRVSQIEEDLPWYAKTWLPNWAEDIFLSKENEALRDEAERLEAENNLYEIEQKRFDDHYMPVTPEFTQGAANRSFSNASKEELYYHDSQFLDYETKWNNYRMGGSMGEGGAILDPAGKVVYEANDYSRAYMEGTKDSFYNSVVQDKLGMYLASTDEDYAEALSVVSGGNSNDTWANLIMEGENNAWRQLKTHEIDTYYYYLNTQGQAAAYKYLDDMTVVLTKRATEKRAEAYDSASTLERLGMNIASIPMNIFGGAIGLVGDAANALEGKEYNPYSAAHSWTNDASAIREKTALNWDKATGNIAIPWVDFSAGDLYQALMSSADSAVGTLLGGKVYGVLMGTGAAHSTMKDMYERGASASQMVAGGLAAGVFEMLFEKYSIDNLVKINDTKTFKTLVINVLKQGGIEASEEAFTEIANIATDYVLMGSQSTWSTSGDTFGERLGAAAQSVGQAGLGGFFSGGFGAAGRSSAQLASYNSDMTRQGAEILARDGADPLKQLALEMAAEENGLNAASINKAASKVTGDVSKKNANKLGKLSDLMADTIGEQGIADVKEALAKEGYSQKDIDKVAKALRNGEKLPQKMKDVDKIQAIINETVGGPDSAHYERQTKLLAAKHGVYFKKDSTVSRENTTSGGVALQNDVDVSDRVSETGETTRISTGEAITIDKSNPIAKVETVDGKKVVYYNTDKGVVEASDVVYASEDEGLLYEAFADMSPAYANAVIKNYDGNTQIQTYIKGMREGVILYGMHNFQAVGKDISKDSHLAELSEADQDFALKLGRSYAKSIAEKGNEALKAAIKNAEEKAKAEAKDTSKKRHTKGKVSFENGAVARTKAHKRAVALAKHLSAAIGIDIVFYDAMTTESKHGKGANGYFDSKTNTIHLDLQNATDDAKTIVFTMSHELVHFIKKWSPAKFNTLATFLMEQYAVHGVSTETLLANKMAELGTTDADLAYEELVADACERMLLDSNAVVKLAQLRSKDAGLFEKIKMHILELLNKIRGEYKAHNYAPSSAEGQALLKMQDVVEKMHELFEDAAVDAAQTYQAAKSLNAESVAVTEDGTIQLQMKQYQETGRATLLSYLREQYGNDNANDLIATIDRIYDVMAEIKEDTALSVFGNWQDTVVEVDAEGRPIFTTSINNGDYELNQDFSRVCKKRRQLNFVLNMLAEDPAFEASNLTKQDFVKINKAIKQHGFEIACALCFVDSKRFRQAEWADSFANTWNDILGSIQIGSKPLSRFNFATKSVNMADEGIQIDETAPISYRKWSDGKVTETRHFKNIHDLLENDGNNNVRAIARLLLENPKLRHEFRGADIIASDGFDMIQRLAPDVRGILDGWGGSSVPKPSSNDAIYDNSVLNIEGYNAKKAFAVGGVRMNSFSDFMAHMFFDYAQAFADLSAKKLPMHSYTKELDFARLFGLTGGKINMSAIAAIRSNAPNIDKIKDKAAKETATAFEKSIAGLDISRLAEKLGKDESAITYDDVIENLDDVDYVWADESVDVKKATLLQTGILYDKLTDAQADYCYELIRNGQIDEAFRVAGEDNINRGYAKHLGIITVGVSKAHILKLLRDPTIRMVIPYHKSGLNPAVAKAMNIAFYDDFTKVQNTSVKKNGKQVGITSDDAKVKGKKLQDFSFYDYFGKTIDGVLYDGKATAAKYLEWCEKGVYDESVGDYVYYISGGGYILASDLHAQGVEIIPKFSEFASEENYYKLVEDFDCYDTITGEHSAQEAVDLFHDGLPSDYKDVLVRALKAEQKVSDDFKDHLDNKGLRDEIMAIVGKNGYTPSDLAATWGDIVETVGGENVGEATEQLTDVENTATIKKQQKKTSNNTYEAIGKELLYYEEGDLAPDLTLVETVNDRTGNTETTIKHYGQKPKGYVPKKIAYCYKLFEQHPDGTLHALFAGATNAVPIGEWRYAQGFPRTDSGVNGMNLRERYGWHLSAGLPSAPHLMSSKSFERGYPSKNAYGHPKGSKRVWVRMAYDASTDFNAIADSTGRQNDIYGLIPFGGYYAFKENNQSEWVISSAVKIDKILDEKERQQILKDAGYDEYEAWRLKYQPTPEERAARELANKERAKAKARAKKLGIDTELSESTKAMREAIKSRIIDNPELNDGIKQQRKKDSEGRTLSAAQQEFFKDSKISRNGYLLVCYHATDADFTIFDKEKIGSGNGAALFGNGFYFTPNASIAEGYGNNIGRYYLNIKNPLMYGNADKSELVAILETSGLEYDKEFVEAYDEEDLWGADLIDDFFSPALKGRSAYEVFSDMVQKAGYDGIWAGDEIVAFDPEQIKRTDNLNPTSDPDTRYQRKKAYDTKLPDNAEAIAKEHFGTTQKWSETGWLLKDGTQLDFSGRHWERDPDSGIDLGEAYYSGKRNVEHYEIAEAFPELREYSEMEYRDIHLEKFLNRGNIRIVGKGIVAIETMPTEEQFEKLRGYFGENVDRHIVIGIGMGGLEYREGTSASTIIEGIRDYFSKNRATQSDLMRFHTDDDGVLFQKKHTSYAPTFYSQMGKVIDGIKMEKIGAASVLGYLTDPKRGIRHDEIKWSGIEAFLEGKRSVTKAELQAFVAGSQLQIIEEQLDSNEIPYTEEQLEKIAQHEATRDEIVARLAQAWKMIVGEDFPIRNVGAGLEHTVTQKILETNSATKQASFEGRLLSKLREDLRAVIKRNDDFGFDNEREALVSIHRNGKGFLDHYELSTSDKAVIVKYLNALEAFKNLPDRISADDSEKLRNIAKTADRQSRGILDVRNEHYEENAKRGTQWGDYKLKGGKNYRELLFKMPDSHHTNNAMYTHWGDRTGVLVHARVQEFDTPQGKMLFIEEIQSDWHNEGAREGYLDSADAATIEALEAKVDEYFFAVEDYSTELTGLAGEWNAVEKTEKGAKLLRRYREATKELEKARDAFEKKVPDAPFRDTYHEYVLKRLIRMAAEEGYDLIGWTPAEMQMDRWNPQRRTNEQMGVEGAKDPNAIAFQEGYNIEYDQEMPRFLRKYGKKWGATVGTTTVSDNTEVWSMPITDSMQQSVLYEGQPKFQKKKLTNRTLLANALESTIDTSTEEGKRELAKLKEYQGIVGKIEEIEARRAELSAEAQKLRFLKGRTPDETKRLKSLEFEVRQADTSINTYDKQLLKLEAMTPVQNVLQREKEMVRKREAQKGREKLAAYREKAAETQRKLLEQSRESRKKAAEKRKMSVLREKIRNFKQDMESTLQHPTEKKYIPVSLVQAMVDVCDIIDTDTSLYKADGSINKAQEMRNATKEKLQTLKDEYEALKSHKDPMYSGEYDEVVYKYLTKLRNEFDGKSLSDMTLSELEEMYDILKSIGGTLKDARKMIGTNSAKGVYETGEAIVAEQDAITKKRKNGKRSAAQKAKDWAVDLSLAPVRNVERISGYRSDSALLDLFKEFERGVRKKNMFVMESYMLFEALTTGKNAKAYEDAIYKAFSNEYTDVNGRKFRLSKMQMMQAIMSYEREVANNMNHIIGGSGFSFADLDMLRKGRLREAISEENSHRVMEGVEIVGQFIKALENDKWAQAYMAAARGFFDGKAKDAVNDAHILLKHRIVARDKNYIPFEVDRNFVTREISAANDIQQTISSYGMLKETKDKAPQPLIITGLNNILERHIEQVGSIHGLAVPIRNYNKVWNVRALSSGLGGDPTVQAAIERNWGVSGKKLIEQTVQDLQGARPNDQSELYKKVKSGYIGAQFLLNGSVVMKQIGSLFTSTSMLRWRDPARMIGNLLYTMIHSKQIMEEVDKYTATVWTRRQGLSDSELYTLATQAKKIGMTRALSKLPAGINPTKWITAMDTMVALSLWKYAKEDTAKRTGLKGEELLKATAEFYDSVIENTQSMTDVLHRPEIQKKSNVIAEAFGMFKTDLYQSAGQIQVTLGRFMTNKTKENGAALAKTIYSATSSALWGSLMTTLFALLRYKVNPYRDEDDELTVESWMKRASMGLVGDLAGFAFPLAGSEAVGVFENIMYGERDDIVDSLALTAINDLYNTTIMVANSVKNGEMPSADQWEKLAIKSLQIFGVPANNISRIIKAIRLHAKDISNGEFMSYEAGLDKPNANRLYHAILSGDEDRIEKASRNYKDQSAIDSAIRKALRENDPRIKEAAQAAVNGDFSKYTKVINEVINEGHFSEEDIVAAVRAEVNAMTPDEEAEESEDKEVSIYEMDYFYTAALNGDIVMAEAIREDIIRTKVANGKKREDAENSFNSSFQDRVQSKYERGELSESEAVQMLTNYGGKTQTAAKSKVQYWAFKRDNPDVSVESSWFDKYNDEIASSGISLDLYISYRSKVSGITGEDKKARRMAVINSLPISNAQKDALYFAEGWVASKLYEAPWR